DGGSKLVSRRKTNRFPGRNCSAEIWPAISDRQLKQDAGFCSGELPFAIAEEEEPSNGARPVQVRSGVYHEQVAVPGPVQEPVPGYVDLHANPRSESPPEHRLNISPVRNTRTMSSDE
ncbi:hypothetical protein RUM44_009253, partial [Polyplax serrata]